MKTAIDPKTARRKGQTIIEAIVGITILTTGLLGMFALLSKSFFLNRVTTDESRATYLAAEGIEIVKNLIDHDVYVHLASPASASWGSCFSGLIGTDTEVDYTTVNCATLVPYAAKNLFFNPATDLYGYANGGGAVATPFTRRIRITRNGSELVVNSIVSWNTGPVAQSVNLEDHFFNWHP